MSKQIAITKDNGGSCGHICRECVYYKRVDFECPQCGVMLRSKYEVRTDAGEIKRWKWLRWCPVCGTPLKVVFSEPWN